MRKRISLLLSLSFLFLLLNNPLDASNKNGSETKITADKPTVVFSKKTLPKNSIVNAALNYGGFTPNDDFNIEIIASEPTIAQPVHISFDARGRMWITHSSPNHAEGNDAVTILEDSNNDGRYDTSKKFLSKLKTATAALPGKNGVWVAAPPCLLFYPDANHDDIPDGPPIVHLNGFGTQNPRSVVGSLQWGPDGWVYGTQGNGCTSTVSRPNIADPEKPVLPNVVDLKKNAPLNGASVWRYHPVMRYFEVFANGGGDGEKLSISFDEHGQIFANANSPAGAHCFIQGGSYPTKKSTAKKMSAKKTSATSIFTLYKGHTFPKKYHSNIFSVNRSANQITAAPTAAPNAEKNKPQKSAHVLTVYDSSFHPLVLQTGPDGALYIGDGWSKPGNKTNAPAGRIYRLQAKGTKAVANLNLEKKTGAELLALLKHPHASIRRTACRLMGERRDLKIKKDLQKILKKETGPVALYALWALHGIKDKLKPASQATGVKHANRWVRYWTIRFTFDRYNYTGGAKISQTMADLATNETFRPIRLQLAATVKRMPINTARPVLINLLAHQSDATDRDIPQLLSQAIQYHIQTDIPSVVKLFQSAKVKNSKLANEKVLPHLARQTATMKNPKLYAALAAIYTGANKTTQAAISKTFSQHYTGSIKDLKEPFATWKKSNP